MFKDVTKIKGLIIDIDSFEEHYREWEPLFEQYQCCFMTEEETLYNELQECYGTNKVLYLEFFEKYFAPSEATHSKVLELMGLSTTEVAYVSKDESFINNALGFLSGTILVKRIPVTYVLASRCPDLVFNSVEILIKRLNAKKFGFYGENSISPESLWKKGSWLPIILKKMKKK